MSKLIGEIKIKVPT